jgi:hypothetical protein
MNTEITADRLNTPEPKSGKPTSHDWARNIHAFADFLLSRPAFEISYSFPTETRLMTFWPGDKDKFLSAAKALGTGKKGFTESEIHFTVKQPWGEFQIKAARSVVCRLVKPAQYECDPFLSPDEEQQLGGGK